MAYWKDLNPLDVDNSYTEYVISEMKYVEWYFIIGVRLYNYTKTRIAFDHFVMAKSPYLSNQFKTTTKMMAYLQDFYPLDIDDS